MIPYRQPASSSGVNQKLMSRTADTSAAGRVDFENTENTTSETTGSVRVAGGLGIAKDLFLKGKAMLKGAVEIGKALIFGVDINTTLTGEDAALDLYTGVVVVLKNAGLTSIASIGQKENGKALFLVNLTGNILLLKAAITGAANDLAVPNGGMLILLYLSENDTWRLVSGSGSGGGINKIVTKTATGAIASDEDCILVEPGADMTLTLPAGVPKQQVLFIRSDSVEARAVTIACSGAEQILSQEGLKPSVTLPYQGNTLRLIYLGANIWGAF